MSDSVTPWTAAHQASLSFTIFWKLLKLMSIEVMMSSNRLILCGPIGKKSTLLKQDVSFCKTSPLNNSTYPSTDASSGLTAPKQPGKTMNCLSSSTRASHLDLCPREPREPQYTDIPEAVQTVWVWCGAVTKPFTKRMVV